MAPRKETIQITRRKIMDSFWELFNSNELKNITVGKITKQAHLNRGTFYQHFNDIYDLLEQMEQQLIDLLKENVISLLKEGVPENLEEFSKVCSKVFQKYNKKLYLLFRNDPSFGEKIKNEMYPVLEAANLLPENFPYKNYVMTFGFYSMLNMINYWYENPENISPEELVYINQTLLLKGISGFSKKER